MLGSESSVPAGTTIAFWLLPNQGREDPHFLQKDVAKCFVSLGSNRPTRVSPEVHLKCSGATMIFDA